MNAVEKQKQALVIVKALGLPQSATEHALRALPSSSVQHDAGPRMDQASAPYYGITPIMDWAKKHYAANYAPNTRETFRRQTMHQFVAAGLALYNPDNPARA